MVGILEPSVFVCAVLVQLAGLASIFFARLSERSWAQSLCQRVFYGCLMLVGCVTVVALLLGSGSWASCGATLAIMAVGVTFDLGRAGREALI